MAVGEKRSTGVISQVSWTDGTAQDVYYGQEHSFQYAANINCDDEMHGIKLSQYAEYAPHNGKCQLISCGEHGVMALKVGEGQYDQPYMFNQNNFSTGGTPAGERVRPNDHVDVTPGVVFQDRVWYGITLDDTNGALCAINNTGAGTIEKYKPCDHTDYTDEAIETPSPDGQELYANGNVSAILNYNNTRLVVAFGGGADGTSIWVYYPELDKRDTKAGIYGLTGWKKVLTYEAGVTVVAMTCTFEYLKVWAVDEGWNTKVYYYQGNNNLRSTFVYNVVDLTGVRVTRVYSINGIDYYTASIDGTDGFVTLYKMVGNTPIELFHVRGGLATTDINYKAPYFVGPCGIEAAYNMGKFYIADAYGLFQFTYNPQGYDKGYMKWKFRDQSGDYDISKINKNSAQPYGVCYNQGYIYVSDSGGCWKIRAYATGKEGYQNNYPGVLISREFEGREGGTITKMLDEVRLNYELNNDVGSDTGSIDVYLSPNNTWGDTHTFTEANGWYHVMHIDSTNKGTRTEKSNLFNDMGSGSGSSFKFDWQTITYAIVINQPSSDKPAATPIVRQIDIRYHTKDKVNNVYDIN